MSQKLVVVLVVAAVCAGLWGCMCCRHNEAKKETREQPVTLSEVPTAPRAAIQRLTAGGEIKKLIQEGKGAKAIYDVEARVGGKDVEYDVDAGGNVLSNEESVEYASLPAAVRAAAEKYFGSAEGLKAAKEVEKGKTAYEVEGKKGGASVSVAITESGAVAAEEKD